MTINFGLLDTATPEKLGALPGNALAQYVQMSQQMEARAQARKEAETRNALAGLQLKQGQREMDEEDAFKAVLAGVQDGNYDAARGGLMKASPARTTALFKGLADEKKAGVEAAISRFKLIDHVAGQFAANPTRQNGVWVLSQLAANGTPPAVIEEMSAKLNAARDEDLPRMAQAFLAATQEGIKAQVERLYPKPGAPSSLGRLIAERDALPPDDPRRPQYDAAIELETTRKDPQPYYQFLPSGEGYLRGDARTGRVTPVTVGGGPSAPPMPGPAAPVSGAPAGPVTAAPPAPPPRQPLPAAADPDLQRRLAAAKAAGTAEGERKAAAQADLPRAEAQADELLRLTDDLLKHPGLKTAVGGSSVFQIQRIPGTDAHDFTIRLDQIKGKQFLEAYSSLKGSGAITDVEGKKATEALARMDASGSEEEFIQAVHDFQDVVRAGRERMRARAGGGGAAPQGSDSMPPPSEHVGRTIRDSATGIRYRSDGQSWVRVP